MKNRIICVLAAVVLLAPVAASAQDTDSDGVLDATDNCILVPNPLQRDTDSDGFGNFCDGDFNQDTIVNINDLGFMRLGFFGTDPDLDLNGDGFVNFIDLLFFKIGYLQPPGPAAVGP